MMQDDALAVKTRSLVRQFQEIQARAPDKLIESALGEFFQALSAQDTTMAQAVAAALESMAEEARTPEMRAWAAYMVAILDIESYRWDEAEVRALQALHWTEDPGLKGRLYNELGILSDQLGRWEEAIRYYRAALDLFQAVGDQVYEGKVRKNLGTAMTRTVEAGELPFSTLDEAEAQERRALAIFESLGVGPLAAATCNELGAVFKAMGRWDEARQCYHRYREERRIHGDAWGEGQALNNLAETFYAEGNVSKAVELWRQALPRVTGHFWDEVDVRTHLAQAYKTLGRLDAARTWSESAMAMVESVRSGLASSDARMDFFALHQRPYQVAAGVALPQKDWSRVLTLSEQARARTFAEMLAHRGDEVASIVARGEDEMATPLTAEDILARLPEDAGVLVYFETDETLVAMLVQRGSVKVVDLNVSLQRLAGASFDLRGRPRGLLAEDGRLGTAWLFDKLGALLLRPLERELTNISALWIIPHGALHHLPLAAMPVLAGDAPLEIQASQVALAPSITMLLRRWRQMTKIPVESRGFLGYNGDALHYAELEALALARQWDAQAFVGNQATTATLTSVWSRDDLLHLACPGLFRPDQPLQSGVQLADGLLKVTDIFRLPVAHNRMVILSACETGRGRVRRGEEVIGMVRAWLYAGADAVLVSLWQVDDLATLLLMDAFYDRLQTTSPAQSLIQAKRALRAWTLDEIETRYRALGGRADQWKGEVQRLTHMWRGTLPAHPLDHPYFWAAFILHGAI